MSCLNLHIYFLILKMTLRFSAPRSWADEAEARGFGEDLANRLILKCPSWRMRNGCNAEK